MALTETDYADIKGWLITHGTNVTSLPRFTSLANLITLPAVDTTTRQVVSVPLTAIFDKVDELIDADTSARDQAIAAAVGAAKAQSDLEAALRSLGAVTTQAQSLITNIEQAILAYLTPITQQQYDALVQAGTLENRPYLIYEE